MGSFGRNVLRELGQEIQGIQNLKIPFSAGSQIISSGIGKGLANVFLGLVDNLPGFA